MQSSHFCWRQCYTWNGRRCESFISLEGLHEKLLQGLDNNLLVVKVFGYAFFVTFPLSTITSMSYQARFNPHILYVPGSIVALSIHERVSQRHLELVQYDYDWRTNRTRGGACAASHTSRRKLRRYPQHAVKCSAMHTIPCYGSGCST